MRPGESAQFLGPGTGEQRDDDVGVWGPVLGGGQERGGLVVGERFGRAALLALRDVAEEHDIAFYLVPRLRAGDGSLGLGVPGRAGNVAAVRAAAGVRVAARSAGQHGLAAHPPGVDRAERRRGEGGEHAWVLCDRLGDALTARQA